MSETLSPVPQTRVYFTDSNGAPLAGGFVYTYTPGTTNPAETWIDPQGITPNPNPIQLDGSGSWPIFGTGAYRLLVKDKVGNTISDGTTNTGAGTISGAMAPIVSAETVADAIGLLGLSLGVIVPATAVISGTVITLTRQANTNAVLEELGGYLTFTCPASATGPFTIVDSSDGIAALPLYDSPGVSKTAGVVENQTCIVGYSPAINAWVLVNPGLPGGGQTRFQQFTSSGTWVAPSYISTAYLTMTGGGGAGGAGGAGGNVSTGGGGGGAAETFLKEAISVTGGGTYSITIGTAGIGALGAAGTAGGASYLVSSGFTTLASALGGNGGALGTSSSGTAAGGAAGGTGGQAGAFGHYFGTTSPSDGGFGGGNLLSAGGFGGIGNLPGGSAPSFGAGGGGGGSGATTGSNAGGNGGPGYVLLEW